jgi:hypothetical protein
VILKRAATEDRIRPRAWSETWGSFSATLVKCWENGRVIREARTAAHQEVLSQVSRGELPSLSWKGGFEADPDEPTKTPKMKKKYGCLQYLATLQGIKGADLAIDTDEEVSIRCARTGVVVVFTSDSARWTVG